MPPFPLSKNYPLHIPRISSDLENLHVTGIIPLPSPAVVKASCPLPPEVSSHVTSSRNIIRDILSGKDPRLLVIAGPCSIHDPSSALEYATRLKELSLELEKRCYVIMRVYFEKPRTTVGWKGLISDPNLDDSGDMVLGVKLARKLLLDITSLSLPTATEFLDPIIPQYTADLVCWAAIGARTTESQTHREMASGLSMPVGFKNATTGHVQPAIDAIISARSPHSFLGIDDAGRTSVIKTSGNPDCHLVLRGGYSGPNYTPEETNAAIESLRKSGIESPVIVDCSHANSGKDPYKQERALESVLSQRSAGKKELVGIMLESHLESGSQPFSRVPLSYGVSITDACLGWQETARLLSRC